MANAVVRVLYDEGRVVVASLCIMWRLSCQVVVAQRSNLRLSRILRMQDVLLDDNSVVRFHGKLYVLPKVRPNVLAECHHL